MLFENKQPNRSRIFEYILHQEKTSRQNIAIDLHLSLPTVVQYLEELVREGLVTEEGFLNSTSVGRKATAIAVNATARIALGMDITRNHISLVAVNLCGKILTGCNEVYSFTDKKESYQHLGALIEDFIRENAWDKNQILGVGISLPAIISEQATAIEQAVLENDQIFFYKQMSQYCPVPFQLINDANAGGFSEIYFRKNISRMVYLSLSHSIGGAIIEENQIVRGNHARAGEFGHMTLIPDGKLCYCGKHGCANCYCSPDILAAYADNNLDLFFEHYEDGDAICRQAFDIYLENLSILLHNIRMCFDCDIIIGGGMGVYMNRYNELIREKVSARDHFENRNAEYILPNSYGSHASAIGAGLFFISEFIRSI